MSEESAAAGASRRGGTQPWTGSWGEWGPSCPAGRPRRSGSRLGSSPAHGRAGAGGAAVGGARANRWAREGRPPSGEAPAALPGAPRAARMPDGLCAAEVTSGVFASCGDSGRKRQLRRLDRRGELLWVQPAALQESPCLAPSGYSLKK